MGEKRPRPGERYRHLKEKSYQVITVAIHSETQEELVIYQALYGDFAVYAKPLIQFISEMDWEIYPTTEEVISKTNQETYLNSEQQCQSENKKTNHEIKRNSAEKNKKTEDGIAKQDVPDKTKILMHFLDCDSYEEKLEYLRDVKKYIDDRMIDNISFAMDLVIEEGELEDRIRTLENCLKTFRRYEGSRLR